MDFLAILLGGGVGGLLTAVGALYLLRAQREKLRAETENVEAETENVEASASETNIRASVMLVETYRQELCRYQSERALLIEAVAQHEKRLKEVQTQLDTISAERDDLRRRLAVVEDDLTKAKERITELESENRHYLRLLKEHEIPIQEAT